jgi:DNA modification methylase
VADIVASRPDEQWLIWCNLNSESIAARLQIHGAVEVSGSDTPEFKEESMLKFAAGEIRVLISKPSICGFGMNFQACHNVAFLGLSDSYEQFYQAVRRCWRFGQKQTVNCHIVTSSLEGQVVENIKRKERDAAKMAEEMVNNMHSLNEKNLKGSVREQVPYVENRAEGENWELYLGDSVEIARKMKPASVHYVIYSPPFASLYTYSASDRDMGNCRTHEEFYNHFKFLIDELFRILLPGRLMSVHCMNLPTSKARDGYIGISDFRGDLIRMFREAGFIYHSEVVIWKDPVTAMQRTKALGLLHKQIKKDSAMSRQGIPDYLVTMRKPGENPEPVSHSPEDFPVSLWQRYASPVWMDINPSDTLQRESAREHKDEKHIAPLQLEVIARALKLWSNPGDLVLSPFAGIGSEGYEAVKAGRRFVGCELKESYWKQAVENLKAAEQLNAGLFVAD